MTEQERASVKRQLEREQVARMAALSCLRALDHRLQDVRDTLRQYEDQIPGRVLRALLRAVGE